MTTSYDFAVFIGRMQPPHLGHLEEIKRGLELADKVLICLGSHRVAPSTKNPWTAAFKKSKRGKLKLERLSNGDYRTVSADQDVECCLIPVFRDGNVLLNWEFHEVRGNAK